MSIMQGLGDKTQATTTYLRSHAHIKVERRTSNPQVGGSNPSGRALSCISVVAKYFSKILTIKGIIHKVSIFTHSRGIYLYPSLGVYTAAFSIGRGI